MSPRKRNLRPPWSFLPAVCYYGIIYYLSSRSSFPVESPFSGFDKLAHVALFGIFGALLARGFAGPGGRPGFRPPAAALFLGALGGILDEVHQIFVPGRSADVWDAAADAIGTAVGALLFVYLQGKRLERIRKGGTDASHR